MKIEQLPKEKKETGPTSVSSEQDRSVGAGLGTRPKPCEAEDDLSPNQIAPTALNRIRGINMFIIDQCDDYMSHAFSRFMSQERDRMDFYFKHRAHDFYSMLCGV